MTIQHALLLVTRGLKNQPYISVLFDLQPRSLPRDLACDPIPISEEDANRSLDELKAMIMAGTLRMAREKPQRVGT